MKEIVGYEGYYLATNTGQIFSVFKNRFLKPGKSKTGYLGVVLCKNGTKKNHLVHRLIAKAFIYTDSDKLDVNHKDGIKSNNNVENLEWCTRQENIKHAHLIGLSKSNLPKINPGNEHFNCRPILKLSKQNELLQEYPSIQETCKEGYKASAISMCLNGTNKTSNGFKWSYKN